MLTGFNQLLLPTFSDLYIMINISFWCLLLGVRWNTPSNLARCVFLPVWFCGSIAKRALWVMCVLAETCWLIFLGLKSLSPTMANMLWLTLTDNDVSISFETDAYKKGGSPGFEPLISRTPNPWSPVARHACDTARPAFPYLYRPTYCWWCSRT